MANKATLALAALLVLMLSLTATPKPTHAVSNISHGDFMVCQPAATMKKGPTPGPSKECCTAMRMADLKCICSYMDFPWLSLYSIDPKRAMELPGKCRLATPPNC